MHYYRFNIADYRKDTVHLSRIEHAIYRELIDLYYLDEKAIPEETQSVMRRLRVGTQEERDAFSNVLNDFFEFKNGCWHHPRIDEEIDAYRRNKDKNRANGKKGGRPKAKEKQPVTNTDEDGKPSGFPVGSQAEPNGNPNHKPLTTNHEPETNVKSIVPATQDAVSEVDQAFDVFWQSGLTKQQKKKAFVIFKRKAGREPMVFAEKLRQDISTRFRLGQFGIDKLHPTTYLNGERWEDEYPSSSAPAINGKNDLESFREQAQEDPFL